MAQVVLSIDKIAHMAFLSWCVCVQVGCVSDYNLSHSQWFHMGLWFSFNWQHGSSPVSSIDKCVEVGFDTEIFAFASLCVCVWVCICPFIHVLQYWYKSGCILLGSCQGSMDTCPSAP